MAGYSITCVVHQEGLDVPLADFPTWQEAEDFILHYQQVDNLEREFREWFDHKVVEYGISPSEAKDAIRLLLNNL
jgi:hypothetical protein